MMRQDKYVPPPPDPQMTKLLGWLFILMGLPLAFYIGTRIYDKLDSASWPSVSAQVISSEMYRRAGRGGVDWCIKMHYRYSVDGKLLSSRAMSTSRVGNASCVKDKEVMSGRLKRFRPGADIEIRYKPTDPRIAIVYVGQLDLLDYLFPAISLVLLAGGIMALREGEAMRIAHSRQRVPYGG